MKKNNWKKKKKMFKSIFLLLVAAAVLSECSHEFQVYRMQQFEMPVGHHMGSKVNAISMEAKTMSSKLPAVSRRCVLIKLEELSLETYRSLVANYAGSIIAIIPQKFNESSKQVRHVCFWISIFCLDIGIFSLFFKKFCRASKLWRQVCSTRK